MSDLKNGAMTIQRAQVLDTLRGLALSRLRQPGYTPDDYQAGFADALLCVAVSIGVEAEFMRASNDVFSRINTPI